MQRHLARRAGVRRFGRRVATMALAAGLLVAVASGPAAAEPTAKFDLCSPLGCALQRTTGTITWPPIKGAAITTVDGSATDAAVGASLTVVVEFLAADGTSVRREVTVDDATSAFHLTNGGAAAAVRVSACVTEKPELCSTATFTP